MSRFESEILAQLEREDPEEAQAFREEIEDREAFLEHFYGEMEFDIE